MKKSFKEIKDRRNRIIDLLNHHKTISLTELSKILKVSIMTVRRDCSTLANMGKIRQNRGVVSLITPEEIPFTDSVSYIKKRLGQEAASYIHDGDLIFINSSVTAFEAIPYLLNKDVNILTNNGYAGNLNVKDSRAQIILSGGNINRKLIMSGDLAATAFSSMHTDWGIIGCSGISAEHGIKTPLIEEARVNRIIIQQSRKLIVVADYSKFNQFSNFTIGSVSDIDVLITDTFVSDQVIQSFIKAGVQVIQVPLQ